MNGISPFNYRKLTPEQEKRGEKIANYFGVCVGIVMVGAVVWLLVHPLYALLSVSRYFR
jgi:hypothetical protein